MEIYLRTARMVLRQFTVDDIEALVELDSDPEVMRYISGGQPTPEHKVRTELLPRMMAHYDRGGELGYWAAQDREAGEFLGWFHLRPPPPDGPHGSGVELGYRLRRAVWGRGLATEGSRALIDKAFTELGQDRVYAQTMAVNAASRRVMEKAGLRFVRLFHWRWADPIPGAEHGEVEYALTRGSR